MYLKHFLPHVLWTFLTSCTLNISYLICCEHFTPHVLWTFPWQSCSSWRRFLYVAIIIQFKRHFSFLILALLARLLFLWLLFFFFIQMVFEFDLALLFFENNNNNKKTRWLGNSGPLCWESELWKVLSFTPGESQESFSCSVYCQEFHLSNFWLSDLFKFICA